jgi:hypothetical protein
MFKDFRALGERISKVPAWAGVAVLLAVLLMGYYGLLGTRYWQATGELPSLDLEFQSLSRTLRLTSADDEDLVSQLEEEENSLESVINVFLFPDADDIISLISETARETSIALLVVNADAPLEQAEDAVRYRAQSFEITIQGESEDMFEFIDELYQRVPTIKVTSLRIADLDNSPSAQVGLQALLDPKEITEEEKK